MPGVGGIFGFFSKNGVPNNFIKVAAETLSLFGRDGYGIGYNEENGIVVKKYLDLKSFMESMSDLNISYAVIGLCRYAVYGRPAKNNTPPHIDCKGKITVVARGILQNQAQLIESLMKKGHLLEGKDLASVIVHYLEESLGTHGDMEGSVQKLYSELEGMYSALILDRSNNGYLISRGLCEYIGIGADNVAVCSEYDVLLEYSKNVKKIKDGVIAIRKTQVYPLLSEPQKIGAVRKKVPGGYEYFMEREMEEIPWVLEFQNIVQKSMYVELATKLIKNAGRVYMIGSGSSFNATLYGAYAINELSDVEPIAQNATEFIYFMLKRVRAGDVIIANSQSGKSSDVLRAVSKSRLRGALIVGVLNLLGSPLMFASNVYIPIAAGIENAIPATKTFVAQLYTFAKIALKLSECEGSGELMNINEALYKLPKLAEKVLEDSKIVAKKFAEYVSNVNSIFVLGRGISFPIALEGALKLKEVAQIHAEGIDAGEFRHGSKTLLGDNCPVIVMVPQAREDTYSLIDEIKDVSSILIVTCDTDPFADKFSRFIVKIPTIPELLAPILYILVLQRLALYLGIIKGRSIDQPPMLRKYVVLTR